MASQSPGSAGTEDERGAKASAYMAGWAALYRAMLDGRSWSGNERKNCFANLGAGRFAEISYVSGLDFVDDGRAVVATDQDGDGDLDLWLRNRTGPQLRLMRNDHDGEGHWLRLALEGTRSNRDAVGARVEVRSAGRRLVRWVAAGEGYLAQSSRRLHFGLGPHDRVESVTVHWPGGATQSFGSLAVDRGWRLREGADAAEPVSEHRVRLPAGPAEAAAPAGPTRVLLRVPLPLPPTLTRALAPAPGEPPAMLVNLWAHWCEPCAAELADFATGYAEIRAAGLRVAALSLDGPADQERAAAWFAERVAPKMSSPARFAPIPADDGIREALAAIFAHVLGKAEEQVLPASLLVDERGLLQMVVLGPIDRTRLLDDARRFAVGSTVQAARRSLTHGRWYFRMPRPFPNLASDLERRGLTEDARFYRALQLAESAAQR